MKKTIQILCWMMLFLLFIGEKYTYAANDVHLMIDGKIIESDVPPKIVNSRTMIPLRVVVEKLGAEVKWDDKKRQIDIVMEKNHIQLVIEKKLALIDGKQVELDQPPIIQNARTLVPLRFIGESLGVNVGWDATSYNVLVNNPYSLYVEKSALPMKDKIFKVGDEKFIPISTLSDSFKVTAGEDIKSKRLVVVLNGKSFPLDIRGSMDYQKEIKAVKIDNKILVPYSFVQSTLGIKVDVLNKEELANYQKEEKGETPSNIEEKAEKNSTDITNITKVSYFENSIIINTDKKVSFKDFSIENPFRIVVDFPQTELNKEVSDSLVRNAGMWYVETGDAGKSSFINQIRFGNYSSEPQILRLVVQLNDLQKYQIQQNDKEIVIQVGESTLTDSNNSSSPVGEDSSTKPNNSTSQFTVLVDAGHGGTDPGSKGIDGILEKNYTLDVATLLANELKTRGFNVLMTRWDDMYPTLQQRVDMANNSKVDLFVSVHTNAIDNPSIRGIEVFYTHENSLEIANTLYKKLIETTRFPERKVKNSNLFVTRNTVMPATLLELGFLTNREEHDEMITSAFKSKVSKSLAQGIVEYFQNKSESSNQ